MSEATKVETGAEEAKCCTADWVESSKEKAKKLGNQAVDYVQRKPFQALAIAVGIGFVAGLILKRR